ncbi:hypothetical protein GGF46_002657 [Coemansia sp. RSA 552]|nr:hypothetical protein GGF46_002657 [Coemansia sp. RSA 552]
MRHGPTVDTQGVLRRQYTEGDRSVKERAAALDELDQAVGAGDIRRAYAQVRQMQANELLRTAEGSFTGRVIVDEQVALRLCAVVGRQYSWEETLDALNLMLGVRKDQDTKRMRVPGVTDPTVVCAILRAILSPQFAALPERRLAGLTAMQLPADYDLKEEPQFLGLLIRAYGFLSDIHKLRRFIAKHSAKLSPEGTFELALAYARCMAPQEALDILNPMQLTAAQQIEAQVALCQSYAETGHIDQALERLCSLETNELLWDSADPTRAERQATMLHLRLGIAYAGSLAVTRRLPFTERMHTIASTHCSPRFTPGYEQRVLETFRAVAADIGKLDAKKQRRLRLDSRLFCTECMVYSMSGFIDFYAEQLSLDSLTRRLAELQREVEGGSGAYGPDYVSNLLRHYMWALVSTKKIHRRKLAVLARNTLTRAIAKVPGFKLSSRELEPVLLMLLPNALWSKTNGGTNFTENSAFMPADSFLNGFERISRYTTSRELEALAHRRDLHLLPMRVMLAVTQGQTTRALSLAKMALDMPQLAIQPGTLSLGNARDTLFFEHMALALSMFRVGAELAVSQLRPLMLSQLYDVMMTERMAVAFLYCCVRAREMSVANEIYGMLEQQKDYVPSARVDELYMRVCFRCGRMSRALALFDRLAYRHPLGDYSFVLIIDYMAFQRNSSTGADHVFDVWMQISACQGVLSSALRDRWRKVGMSKDAVVSQNAFLPKSGLSVVQALEGAGIESADLPARPRFLRNWEVRMVTALICAYVNSGCIERATSWVTWIMEAVKDGRLFMKAEYMRAMAYPMRQLVETGSWDCIRLALDLLITIDRAQNKNVLPTSVGMMCMHPVYSALAKMANLKQVKTHLVAQDFGHIFRYIEASQGWEAHTSSRTNY